MTVRHTQADDAGAMALTGMLVVLAALAVVLPLVLVVADLLAAGGRARTAADAAALAALAGSPLAGGSGEPDIRAAEAIARANGAELVGIDDDGWPVTVVVVVEVRLSGPIAGRIGAVPARAAARAVPP